MFFTVTEHGKGVVHIGTRYKAVRALMATAGAVWRRVHAHWDGYCGQCGFCKFKTPRQPTFDLRLEIINNTLTSEVTKKEHAGE